jgi:quercetin 2,3-dioxygenase
MKSTLNHAMIKIRPANERGHANHGWLDTYHTFSFASYIDPNHMGFRDLRVINEDRIAPGKGFGEHPHQDMEIVSYVVSGGLRHQDSMGNKSIILPDEVQIMSAGTGVVHAEMNHYNDQQTHFFQIWILPQKKGLKPSYGQKSFKSDFEKKNLVLVVSKTQRDGSIGIHQDADIYIGRLKSADIIKVNVSDERHIWVQMIAGMAEINSQNLTAGDGLALSNERTVSISAKPDAEFILFDLA